MLKGVCTPVCTPFKDADEEVDEKAFLRHIDTLLDAGIHIIAVCDECGEFPFLDARERRRLAELAARHIEGRARLVVQTSAIRTRDAVEFSKHAADTGADALLVFPSGPRTADENAVFHHYEQICKAVKTPIIVNNAPAQSGFDVTPAVFKFLEQLPTVKYIKDCTGSMMRIEQLVADGAEVFCGCDYLMPYALMTGGIGCFWGGSNVMPDEAVMLYNYVIAGKLREVMALWHTIKKANVLYWTTNVPAAIKASMQIMGRDLGDCRQPVLPFGAETVKQLRDAHAPLLRRYGALT